MTNHSTLGKNYTYDANGNMLARGSQTLAWTIDNRVASVSISGGGTTSMEYDYSGMRVKKSAPAGVTLYPFMGYEIDPNGLVTKFIRAGGESIASKKGANKYFYHNDHLGSVNVVTDATGVRVQLNEYDPWGAVSRASGNIDPDTRFTGQKLDPETGLYFYNGRYYDAEIGRFVSADPFIQTPYDPQNLNRFTYVRNNPQNYVDPSGYFHKVKKPSFWKRFGGLIIGTIASIVTLGASAVYNVAAIAAGSATISATTAGTLAGAVGGFTGGVVNTANGGNPVTSILGGTFLGGLGGMIGGYSFGALGGNASAGFTIGNFAPAVGAGAIAGAVTGAVGTGIYGGKFGQNVGFGALGGAGSAAVTFFLGAIREYYKNVVGFDVDPRPGGDAVRKDDLGTPVKAANNTGFVNCDGMLCEGGLISRIANQIPIVNATAGLHDSWWLGVNDFRFTIGNVPTMPPAFAMSLLAIVPVGAPGTVISLPYQFRND